MNRLPLLSIMLEIKSLTKSIEKATSEVDIAWVEEMREEKFQLEMELY
jgi:hypothetical protein